MKRLEEIQERWAAATPGWWADFPSDIFSRYIVGGVDGEIGEVVYRVDAETNEVLVDFSDEDVAAFTNAPADIAALTAAVEGVIAKHEPLNFHTGLICGCCDQPYPCSTVRTIDEALDPTP